MSWYLNDSHPTFARRVCCPPPRSGYWAGTPNPRLDLVAGALVWGPGASDEYNNTRQSDSTRVTVHGTAPLTGVLAGLEATSTGLRSCQMLHGG